MAKKKKSTAEGLDLTRVSRSLFFFIGVFALTIVIFDSGNLLTRSDVINRWSLISGLFAVNTVAWFAAATSNKSYKILLTYALAVGTLAVAGFMTYWERGMASTSTLFYVLPLLIVATLRNRHALLATAALSAATYAFAAVTYFNDFFNEGYRIQLWGSIALYSGTILAVAWLIMIIAGLREDSK